MTSTRACERPLPLSQRKAVWLVAWISLHLLSCGLRTPAPVAPSVLGQANMHDVPELLASLPADLREHYVLLFESRSPEKASYESPRVIFYGKDARQVVAFSGSTDTVQVMTFDDAESSFKLQEARFVAGQMVVSEINPPECRACHGSPARPIWDTYPLWPGAYGERAEMAPSDEERQGFARFERARTHDARYRYVPSHVETQGQLAERQYHGRTAISANAELGQLLGALNARTIARELRATTAFESERYVLLEALVPACASSIRTGDAGFAGFEALTEKANEEEARYKALRSHSRRVPAGPERPLTELRYVAESRLGLATYAWTLAFERGTYDFATGSTPLPSVARALFSDLAGPDGRLRDLYWQAADPAPLCAELGRRAAWHTRHGRADNRSSAALLQPPGAGGPLLEQCASCHEHGVGPAISFADPTLLRTELSGGSLLRLVRDRLTAEAGAARMPLGSNPSVEERTELLVYLEGLASSHPDKPQRMVDRPPPIARQ